MPRRPPNVYGQPPKRRGASSHERGYGRDWQRQAAQVYGQPCELCGDPADTADHTHPRAQGGPALPAEAPRPLCRSCNASLGANRPAGEPKSL